MPIRPIRGPADLDAALARVEALWGSPPDTPEGDELDVLVTLIEAYEAHHHAIPPGDPIEVVQYKMKELGLSQNALARRLGWSSGRVSEILGRKRSLTLTMIRALSDALTIPAGLLVGEEASSSEERLVISLSATLCERLRASFGAKSGDLDQLVAAVIGQALSARRAPSPRSTTGIPLDQANEPFCLRAGYTESPHSRLAA